MSKTSNTRAYAEIMVVDFFEHLWPDYQARLGGGRTIHFRTNIADAASCLMVHKAIKLVVVQGLSRFSSLQWWESSDNTRDFVELLADIKFDGQVFVVSQSLAYHEVLDMQKAARGIPLRILSKDEFFDRPAQPLRPSWMTAEGELWAEYERLIDSPYSLDLAKAEGVDMALDWLRELRESVITTTDDYLHRLYAHVVQLPQTDRLCWCREEHYPHRRRWQRWLHQHHGLFNRAVYEVLRSDPVLIALLALELEDDMTLPEPWLFRQDQRLEFREFLRINGPAAKWVDRAVVIP